MRRVMFLVPTLAVLALVGGYCTASTRSFPIKPEINRYYYGHITRGTRFGFRIGDPFRRDLEAERKRHLAFYGASGCAGTFRVISGCRNARKHASYSISTLLYHGQVFVELSADGSITAILWSTDVIPMK